MKLPSPASSRSASYGSIGGYGTLHPGKFPQVSASFQQLAGHDHALDLVGALVDLRVLGVAGSDQHIRSSAGCLSSRDVNGH